MRPAPCGTLACCVAKSRRLEHVVYATTETSFSMCVNFLPVSSRDSVLLARCPLALVRSFVLFWTSRLWSKFAISPVLAARRSHSALAGRTTAAVHARPLSLRTLCLEGPVRRVDTFGGGHDSVLRCRVGHGGPTYLDRVWHIHTPTSPLHTVALP